MSVSPIETLLNERRVIAASDEFKANAIARMSLVEDARQDRLRFWADRAQDLHWVRKWDTVLEWNRPYAQWFKEGQLNAAYNCLDIHLGTPREHKTAIIWEGEDGRVQRFTYRELYDAVSKFAGVLKHQFNIQKQDTVTIYMPMIPQLAIAVLACARIGAIHSVVFGGFSAKSLNDRLLDARSTLLITADGGYRRGQVLPLFEIAKEAIQGTLVKQLVVASHVGTRVSCDTAECFDFDALLHSDVAPADAEPMNSEDTLFILYTSGTTGKPKGIMHSTGGYMTHAKYSTQLVFDLKEDDVYWCTADIGWITGHTYFIYGPMSNGATQLMFEGTPDFPHPGRFWELIQTHRVSIFYTAPTAIRAFMKSGDQIPAQYDLSSLRLLGSVGEPINPEAWMWYYTQIGQKKCPIVDTWWQTETGGVMICTLPALNGMKPGKAGLPLPGISASVLDESGRAVSTGGGLLSLTEPWPSMARGIWGDNNRFKEVYWSRFETYFAGDGATVDTDGYFMVLGRVDDVLNVAGHRIGTMEVESSLVGCAGVAEAAVVGVADEIKGQAIQAYVILKEGVEGNEAMRQRLMAHVAKDIGAIAKPKHIVFTPELPKTRSGKIMRRILKQVAAGEEIGDVTTLANPGIVMHLVGM